MSRFEDIRNWGEARNLIAGTTAEKQFIKLMEEGGELAQGLLKDRQAEVIDAIGDMAVVLTIMAAQRGLKIEDCIEHAWDVIKDRKGRMVNGVFVKEADFHLVENA